MMATKSRKKKLQRAPKIKLGRKNLRIYWSMEKSLKKVKKLKTR